MSDASLGDEARPHLLRRRIAPLAGMALLLSGGALLVRVTAMMLLSEQPRLMWIYTAAACVLAGVALVLTALPAIARVDLRVDDHEAGRPAPFPAEPTPRAG